MVQSSKVTFFFGVLIVFSALLNDSISHARRDIFIHGNKEESIINDKEPSDKELNKITIAHTETDRFKERERMPLLHDTFTGLKCETRDAGDQRQVSGANNSARKCFRGTKEDMRISSDFKPSSNLPKNTIDRHEIPFTSDYHSAMNHPPKHN